MRETLSGQAVNATLRVVLALVVMASAPAVRADNLAHKVWHYIATHKELLVYDAIVIGGPMADAASTRHCLNYSIYCTEGNGILPPRPSNAQLFGSAAGGAVGLTITGHLLWHFAPRTDDRQILVWIAAPVGIGEGRQVSDNVAAISTLPRPEYRPARLGAR